MNIWNWIRSNKMFLLFLCGLGLFRTAIADWNPIPSGSMRPTLLEGDVVLVNRTAYDLKIPLTDVSIARMGEPRRGDVVTFSSPRDGERLIKRIVGLPGDMLEMRDEVLYVNGACRLRTPDQTQGQESMQGQATQALRATEHWPAQSHSVQFLPAVPAMRSFGRSPFRGSVFHAGRQPGRQHDSRYIGFVPRRVLISRAHHILVSADIAGPGCRGWIVWAYRQCATTQAQPIRVSVN